MAGVEALEKLIGVEVVGKDGNKVSVASLCGKDKVIGLYFSAHWCPPCRGFTPVLAAFYETMKKKNPNFEVVFLSRDQNDDSFKEYYDTMPWLAVPFENQELIGAAMTGFGIRGIPTFVLMDGDTGDVINANARNDVQTDSNGDNFPWKK